MKVFKELQLFYFLFNYLTLLLARKVGIHHWNDISGQIQEIQKGFNQSNQPIPTPCSDLSIDLKNCEGGIENLLYYISQPLPEVSETVALTTGNLVGGENGWLSSNSWGSYGTLVEKYYGSPMVTKSSYYVHTYGLKEFESGLKRTIDYHQSHNITITLANVICPPPEGGDDEKYFCSIRTSVQSLTNATAGVGVAGFINPFVEQLSSPGLLQFEEIVPALLRVANDSRYKSLIAVGDGSLDIAKQILDSVPKVKLVIYGRGFGQSKDMTGEYPMKYGNGWIATAGKYGTTLGKLVVDINDSTGVITNVSGVLVQTNHTIAKKPVMELANFASKARNMENTEIGKSVFKLEGGERCWRDECNLGNLVADAMVHCAYNYPKVVANSTPIVAIWHGGSLVKDTVTRGKTINMLDLHRWLPYHNRAHLVQVRGDRLMHLFNLSASGINASTNPAVKDWGQFLQLSNGLEVYYRTEGNGARVERIRILDEDEDKPVMKDVTSDGMYSVVIPSFIKEGRNVYGLTKSWWGTGIDIGFDDVCLQKYIEALKYVTVGFEERIYINGPIFKSTTTTKGGSTTLTVILTIVFMCLILGIIYVGVVFVYPKLTGRHPDNFRQFRE